MSWRDGLLVALGALCATVAMRLLRKPTASAPACVALAEERKAQLQQQLASYLKGATAMAMLYLGDQLGLYKAMMKGDWTASRLAKAAGGLQPRLVQELLRLERLVERF